MSPYEWKILEMDQKQQINQKRGKNSVSNFFPIIISDCAMIMNKLLRRLCQLQATPSIWWNWKPTLKKWNQILFSPWRKDWWSPRTGWPSCLILLSSPRQKWGWMPVSSNGTAACPPSLRNIKWLFLTDEHNMRKHWRCVVFLLFVCLFVF